MSSFKYSACLAVYRVHSDVHSCTTAYSYVANNVINSKYQSVGTPLKDEAGHPHWLNSHFALPRLHLLTNKQFVIAAVNVFFSLSYVTRVHLCTYDLVAVWYVLNFVF